MRPSSTLLVALLVSASALVMDRPGGETSSQCKPAHFNPASRIARRVALIVASGSRCGSPPSVYEASSSASYPRRDARSHCSANGSRPSTSLQRATSIDDSISHSVARDALEPALHEKGLAIVIGLERRLDQEFGLSGGES